MSSLKEQIKDKLEHLSEGEFQQLANDFVRLYSPTVFWGLNELSGMSLKGHPIHGQPDSYSFYKNGLATVQASMNDDWSGKAREDIDKMSKVFDREMPVNYLCFIFKLMEVKPTDKKINEIKDYAFKKLGVSQEMVDFIFGGNLISELSQPKYAGILYKNLEINLNRKPFKTIIERIQSFDIDFYPKLDDFEKGIVFLPKQRATDAKNVLDMTRHDLGVMGLGSSGKTIFALTLGFGYYKRNHEVLFFDFGDFCDDKTADLIYDFILNNNHENLVIILDNVHLYEKMYTLFNRIRTLQLKLGDNPFKIIYVGRKIWPKEEEKNFLKMFIQKEHGYVINLGAPNEKDRFNSADCESFYNIFRHFIIKNGEDFWKPPNSQLNKWCRYFGNDLFIFAYALYEYVKKGRKLNTFNASRKLVYQKIGSHYLEKYKDKHDFDNFVDLCSLSALDLLVPFSFFNVTHEYERILADAIKEGIVLELIIEQKRYFSFIYPSLAKAIITVLYKNKEKELNQLISCLKRVPELGSTAFRNLHVYYYKDIEYICKGLFNDDEYLESIVKAGYLLPVGFIKTAQKYIPKFKNRVNNIIDSNLEPYISSLASKGIGFSMGHFEYSEKKTQRMVKIFLGLYQNHYSQILKSCPTTPMHVLSSFFRHLSRLQSNDEVSPTDKIKIKDFETKLIDDLTDLNNKHSLFPILIDEEKSLGYSIPLLNLTKHKKPLFFSEVLKTLTDDNNKLAKRTFDTFIEGYQFMISLLNFFDENEISSVKVMENVFKNYQNRFKDEFYKKDEKGQKIFADFFNKKYKEYPEIIQQFNSTIKI